MAQNTKPLDIEISDWTLINQWVNERITDLDYFFTTRVTRVSEANYRVDVFTNPPITEKAFGREYETGLTDMGIARSWFLSVSDQTITDLTRS